MADSFQFDLVSPERLLMSEQVASVVVPGSEGQFMVLADHAPVISTLKPGVVVIDGGEKAETRFFVRGGLAEVRPQGLTILAERAIDLEALDAAALAEQIKNAEEDVADAADDNARTMADAALNELRQLKEAL